MKGKNYMRVLKKITAWTIMAVMLAGTFTPVQGVQAEQPGTQQEEQTDEQPGTQLGNPTEEQPGNPTEDRPGDSTEGQEEKQPEVVVNYKDTGLSPLDAKIVVLDPGHCKKHPGASGNGLKEEVVNLDIALACRDVLDTYGDVIVYMTREDGSCCTELNVGDCLASRNNYAKQLDADFLVSMHINAGSSNGANVLAAYKSGYHDSIRKQTQAFGKIALAKLKALGIKNRGFLLRKSGSGNRYSNGKLADYYSIVRRGVIQQIPSVIIEHGYITSSSDCKKFFKTKAKRKKVGQADAAAIIEYYSLEKPLVEGKLTTENDSTYFVTANNEKLSGWVKQDGKWYYFDTVTGQMQKGFVTIGENTFYMSPNTGEMQTGWFSVNGARYLAKGNGAIVKNRTYSDGQYTYLFNSSGKQLKKGFHTVGDAVYYVNSKKHVLTNCTSKISGKYYGFDEEGKKLFGYQQINGKCYYFAPDTGVMSRSKIVTIDGSRYYFGSSGAQAKGLIKCESSIYYFDKKTGKMVTGWKKISGKYYYFSKTSGKMQKSKWIGKYYVNSKGVRTKKK